MATSEQPGPAVARGARRRERTRASLLSAALDLFAEQGIEATRIADITDRADVGFGSFYNHFTDKDEIVREVVSAAIELQGRTVAAMTAGLDDPAEVVAVAHRYFVRLAARREQSAWLLVRTDLSALVLDATVGGRAWQDIDAGVQSGRFDVPDARLALHATGGALVGVMREALRRVAGEGIDDDVDDVAHAELILRLLGLPADEARKVASRPLPVVEPAATA